METAARCGCARDAYTANPACDTPDGITLLWDDREGCGVLVLGYLYDSSTLLVPTDQRSTGQLGTEGINLLTYLLLSYNNHRHTTVSSFPSHRTSTPAPPHAAPQPCSSGHSVPAGRGVAETRHAG